jgi:hypothetical protein
MVGEYIGVKVMSLTDIADGRCFVVSCLRFYVLEHGVQVAIYDCEVTATSHTIVCALGRVAYITGKSPVYLLRRKAEHDTFRSTVVSIVRA